MDEGNQLGASNLDEGLDGSGTFAPLAPNPLVIDAADPSATHAPITDFYGAPRGSAPDRGAVEYRPPDPAPVYIQSTGARGLSSAPSATYALSPAPGDLLVAAIGVNGAPTINCPAGWTTASVVANGTSVAQAICTKVAGAGEPAQVLASLSTSRNWQMAIAEYRNATVKDQQESATGSSSMLSSGTTPTPTAASELFVALISNRNTDVQSPPGNGFVARYQAQNGTGTNGVSVTYADKIVASQEAAGTFTTVPQARPFVGAVVTFMR